MPGERQERSRKVVQERYTPEMYVAYYARERGFSVEDIGVAATVVLSWGQRVIRSLAEQVSAERCQHWFYDEGHIVYPLYRAGIGGEAVSLVQCPEGAPATVMMMEELIACGAKRIVGLGWGGSLQPVVPIGSVFLPTHCVSQEGTSRHYMCGEDAYRPAPALVRAMQDAAAQEGVELQLGGQWTTDAPYRELCDSIVAFRRDGVVCVDMETSAMYALGQFRGVEVVNILVISDEVWGEWRPAFRSSEVLQATMTAERVLVRFLGSVGDWRRTPGL